MYDSNKNRNILYHTMDGLTGDRRVCLRAGLWCWPFTGLNIHSTIDTYLIVQPGSRGWGYQT